MLPIHFISLFILFFLDMMESLFDHPVIHNKVVEDLSLSSIDMVEFILQCIVRGLKGKINFAIVLPDSAQWI